MTFRSFAREPFLHFLVLGGMIFAAYALWGKSADSIDRELIVTDADIARLEALWEGQFSKSPSTDELASLIKTHIREEVLFREAMALGLGDDDIIVRRRLIQKFEFLSASLIDIPEPESAMIEAWYASHQDRYVTPSNTSFRFVFFSEEKRGDSAQSDAAAIVGSLRQNETSWRQSGDPFMLQREYASRQQLEITELLGVQFAVALSDLPIGEWSGPIRSVYGWHAAKVVGRSAQALQPLSAVWDAVINDYLNDETAKASQSYYEGIEAQYRITVEQRTDTPLSGTPE